MIDGQQFIDGKLVRKFLFGRKIQIELTGGISTLVIEVHAFSKDHAVKRLEAAFPHVNRREWEGGEELGPEHFVGRMGTVLRLTPMGIRSEGGI